MKVTIEILPKHFDDLWVTFIESGYSNYWCGLAIFRDGDKLASYQNEKLYESPDWNVTLSPAEEGDFEPVVVNAQSFDKLPLESLRALVNLLDENLDGPDAEVLIQGAAFKEIVFG